jgi:hypothetical protein
LSLANGAVIERRLLVPLEPADKAAADHLFGVAAAPQAAGPRKDDDVLEWSRIESH